MRHVASHGSITLITLTLWIIMLNATLSSAERFHNHTNNAPRNSTKPYSVIMAESIVKRGNGMGHNSNNEPFINYEHGTFQHALWEMYTNTKNETYLSWIKKGIDNIVTPTGNVIGGYNMKIYTLDDIRVGESMIHLWNVTGEAKYKTAAGILQKQMKSQPRTAEGAFW
jgi:rhamnogalacturonyl hydrolase YesR